MSKLSAVLLCEDQMYKVVQIAKQCFKMFQDVVNEKWELNNSSALAFTDTGKKGILKYFYERSKNMGERASLTRANRGTSN